MADLIDGEAVEVKGSGARPYVLKNVGGVYSCTCPAWRNQSTPIERRTCKHLRKLRGEGPEAERVGQPLPEAAPVAEDGAAGATAPPLLLAERRDNAQDLAGWWMSEKLDGVRAYWDGRRLVSRLGNPFHAPDWFLAGLPDTPLDGELWIGRKAIRKTVGIVRRQDRSDHWKEVAYVAFDAPAAPGPFEDRLASVRDHMARRRPPFARAHDHAACLGPDHLRDEFARVEAAGGEGLMLRQPGSAYEVDHLPGAGRHKGRLGALFVELADGTRFAVGTGLSDAERGAPRPWAP